MGLDLIAFSQIEKVDEDVFFDVNIQPDSFNYILREYGRYVCQGSRYAMRAGSYSHYNVVRDVISEAVIGGAIENCEEFLECSSPIKYLVFFSDCDGVIDAPFCKGIHRELVANKERIVVGLVAHGYDIAKAEEYIDEYIELFWVAADDGVVLFC